MLVGTSRKEGSPLDFISRDDALAVVKFSKDPVSGIENLPIVDAVPVVRCKECRYYKQNQYSTEGDMYCKCWTDWLPTEPDDFCSCGERRSDDGTAL